jgi:hypothetical protein
VHKGKHRGWKSKPGMGKENFIFKAANFFLKKLKWNILKRNR